MDQQVSTSALVVGNRLERNPALQVLILFQVGLELESELRWQNHLIYEEDSMREIRDLASGMKGMVAALRKDAATAKDAFHSEFNRAQVNTDKFKSFTKELSEANAEVESFLGETGSNFPTSEASATPHADLNGVTLNPGAK